MTSRSTTPRSPVPDVLLRTEQLRKEFGGLVAVQDVDFTVPAGAIVSLIGPNGAGKTTFFNMLTGVYKPTQGFVFFNDENMTGKPPHAFTQRGIGRTFQNIRLFQNMTALENVLVGMHVRLKGNLFGAILRTPRVRRRKWMRASARTSCSFSPVSCARTVCSGRTSPTATSGGSRWRARSRRSRNCCCSTSRPRG